MTTINQLMPTNSRPMTTINQLMPTNSRPMTTINHVMLTNSRPMTMINQLMPTNSRPMTTINQVNSYNNCVAYAFIQSFSHAKYLVELTEPRHRRFMWLRGESIADYTFTPCVGYFTSPGLDTN